MITTNSTALYEKLCRLRTHGITREPHYLPQSRRQPWYYEKLELGNHYRMTDIQAALGRSQLKKIDFFQRQRESIAQSYTKGLVNLSLDLPKITKGARSSWHLYPVCIQGGASSRDRVMARLRQAGIQANLHYLPVPRFRFYQNRRLRPYLSCPVAAEFAAREISLPIFPGLKLLEQSKVIRKIGKSISSKEI
jgi:dTDP-4-amino-4,6-dideoxygalactose transaminase